MLVRVVSRSVRALADDVAGRLSAAVAFRRSW
jgi:hypothetical protein